MALLQFNEGSLEEPLKESLLDPSLTLTVVPGIQELALGKFWKTLAEMSEEILWEKFLENFFEVYLEEIYQNVFPEEHLVQSTKTVFWNYH